MPPASGLLPGWPHATPGGLVRPEPDGSFPDVNAVSYEFRFTRLALDDLGCPRGTPAGNLPSVLSEARWPAIVEEFRDQRGINPETTGGTLARCGYPDVVELHGPAGGRAATWYDRDSEVVWFLAFDPQHRYERLETRAANGELMPSVDDETDLELEREKREFDDRVRDDLCKLAKDAAGRPGEIVRGRVGNLLRLEASITAITIASGALMDLFVSVRLPLRPDGKPARTCSVNPAPPGCPPVAGIGAGWGLAGGQLGCRAAVSWRRKLRTRGWR